MTVTRRASAITTAKMPDDLFADLDQAHRRRGCLSCRNLGCVALLVIAAGVVGVLGVVAETGLIQIPVISGILYTSPPSPMRVVEPAGPTSIESLLKTKAQDVASTATSSQLQVSVSEQELTQLVREPRANGEVPIKQAQIVVEPAFVELYGSIKLPSNDMGAVVRIRLAATPQPDELRLSEIKIGFVRVPIGMAKAIIRLATGITPPDTFSGQQFGIQGITLGNSGATLVIDKQRVLP